MHRAGRHPHRVAALLALLHKIGHAGTHPAADVGDDALVLGVKRQEDVYNSRERGRSGRVGAGCGGCCLLRSAR